jgi:hypothetical protein
MDIPCVVGAASFARKRSAPIAVLSNVTLLLQ